MAIVGSGFAGSLLARILAVLGRDVVLLERGTHPRFAIGESTTPLANLSLERIARRYDLSDCYELAAHGRWLRRHPHLRRGLKRGFTFYRHHPNGPCDDEQLARERLLVAASPDDAVSDTHWLRADVDHHFVRAAVAAGVEYRDRVHVRGAIPAARGIVLSGEREGAHFDLRAEFVVDASGAGSGRTGFLTRRFGVRSSLKNTTTRSGVLFSHFSGVRMMSDVHPGLTAAPYPEDWAAVHHIIDEGWMYSLRFDDGVTSAGFALTPRGVASLNHGAADASSAEELWARLVGRYPAIGALFADAKPLFPLAFRRVVQHRRTRAAGDRYALLPHAYAFVDPLFSTGIAWSLRAVERLALAFEGNGRSVRLPSDEQLARYDALLAAEANQVDRLVAGAYESMAHFDLFAAHAMIYFAAVSFAEARQRLVAGDEAPAWSGFLGVDDPVLAPLPQASLRRLRRITRRQACAGSADDRSRFADWVRRVIAPRNIGGFADPARAHMYPVDLDALLETHELLGMTREQLLAALPLLR